MALGPLTPRSVFRYFKVDGVPSSGKHEPIKAEIIQLLETLFGVSRGGWVVARTLEELNGVVPEGETDGGVVLADPDPVNNGYYERSEGAWVKGRGFPDTFARVELSGGGSAQVGAVRTGVNPADIEVFFAFVETENTGPLTLAIGGDAPREVMNLAGNPLSAGEWTGAVMFALRNGKYQLLLDAGAAQAAALEADRASDEADRAEAAAAIAQQGGSGLAEFETRALAEAWPGVDPMPDSIVIRGGLSVGDGGGGLFVKEYPSFDPIIVNGVVYGKTSAAIVQRPPSVKYLHMSDTNGPLASNKMKLEALIDHASRHHPDRDIVMWNGDMVMNGDGTPGGEDESWTLKEWLNTLQGFVSRAQFWPISGNHEVDRNQDGSNPQWSASYETYRRWMLRKLYYYIVVGNACYIRMGAVSRNGNGVIPDEIADWCKRIVADHQWCSYIEIATHQPLEGSGLPGHLSFGILQSERFTSWLGEPGYRVDAWFSGHSGSDFSNPEVIDHNEFKGCMFIATDNDAQTYVDHVAEDRSESITFRRWDVAVPSSPTKVWTINLIRPMETAGIPTYDGRNADDGIFDVRPMPLRVMVQPERELIDGAWQIPRRPIPVGAIGLTDLANDDVTPGMGPAWDFYVPGCPPLYASGAGANNPLGNHSWGYGGRIAALRTGNGEYDFGATLNLYAGLPSTDPSGSANPTEAQNTEEQLKLLLQLGTALSRAYDGAETEVWRWDANGVKVGRTSNTGPGDPGLTLNKIGNIASFMLGDGANVHHRFYNRSGTSPVQVGYIQSEGSSTQYSTSSDRDLKEGLGELSAEKALELFAGILIHEFRWKESGAEDIGVFAQELYEVHPQAVTVGGWRDRNTGQPCDGSDCNAEYQPWGVDYSKLVPILVRSLQGVVHRLTTIEERITLLEANV